MCSKILEELTEIYGDVQTAIHWTVCIQTILQNDPIEIACCNQALCAPEQTVIAVDRLKFRIKNLISKLCWLLRRLIRTII